MDRIDYTSPFLNAVRSKPVGGNTELTELIQKVEKKLDKARRRYAADVDMAAHMRRNPEYLTSLWLVKDGLAEVDLWASILEYLVRLEDLEH